MEVSFDFFVCKEFRLGRLRFFLILKFLKTVGSEEEDVFVGELGRVGIFLFRDSLVLVFGKFWVFV